jgi:hypothetical protein
MGATRHTTGRRRVGGLVTTIALAVLALAPGTAVARTNREPVLIVHGHDPDGRVDCDRFDPLVDQLRAEDDDHGTYRFGEVVPVAFYGGDTKAPGDGWGDRGCAWWAHLSNHGPHRFVSPSGHRTQHGVVGHTTGTSIRHLAFHLAWLIHDRYTSRGVAVDLVGQSMGGLVVRYALAATEAHLAHFPRRLLVDDVVTLGTPLGGYETELFTSRNRQTIEMDKDSAFMAWLHRHALRPPQPGPRRTDWTFVGSYTDGFIPAASTIGRRCTATGCQRWQRAQHDVLYDTHATDAGPMAVRHADYVRLTGYDRTYRARVWRDGAWAWSDTFVSPVRLIEWALARDDW